MVDERRSKISKRNRRKGYAGEVFVRRFLKEQGYNVRRINSLEQRTTRNMKSPDLIVKKDTDIEICCNGFFKSMVQKYECAVEVKYKNFWREDKKETEALKKWGKENRMPIYYGIVKKIKNRLKVIFGLIEGEYWK